MSFARAVRARAGFLLDLYAVARLEFHTPHSFTKFLLIERYRRRHRSTTFIETGTYLGITTERCARTFERVITIELDPRIAERAAAKLAPYPNVQVLQGDAVDRLPDALSQDEIRNAIVFLDAHYSGAETALGDEAEPALEELRILSLQRAKCAAVLIDDFRLFGTENGVPTKSQLFQRLEECFPSPEWDVNVLLNVVIASRRAPAAMDTPR